MLQRQDHQVVQRSCTT